MKLLGMGDYILILLIVLTLLAFLLGFIKANRGVSAGLFAFITLIPATLGYMLYIDFIQHEILQTLAQVISIAIIVILLINEDLIGGLTLSLPFAIILGVVAYINYLPFGIYQARFTEIQGKKIIKGARGSESHRLNIDKDFIIFDNGPAIPYDKNNSNDYVRLYALNGQSISVSKMGTLKVNDKNSFTATMDIKY